MVQPYTTGNLNVCAVRRATTRRAEFSADSVCEPLRSLVATLTDVSLKHVLGAFAAAALLLVAILGVRFVASAPVYSAAGASSAPQTIRITVAPGESLWSLSKKYGNPDANIQDRVDTLARANSLHSSTSLVAGQRLVVPVSNPAMVAQLQMHVASR